MKHSLCARGIAAASLALASTTTSAAPPVAAYVIALPVVASSARLSADIIADVPVTNPTEATAAPDLLARLAQRAVAKSTSAAKPTSGNPGDQRLDELVRDHATAVATDEERGCLAGAVYFEARGELLEGQLAVAEVVLNRAASGEYPATICEVVKQPAQFSFVRNGLFPPIDQSSVAWRTAVAVAHIAVEKLADKLASDVLWYHADYIAPAWGRRLARATQIGAHVFYRRA